eukprot:Hpha_TRINITY_DN16550_c0_g7::TRINITY_DN16550_c0_g7_i1::g.132636::m.132636
MGGLPLLDEFALSVRSVATVICCAGVGVYARHKGVLTRPTVKALEKGVKEIWTPAIILANVAPVASPSSLVAVWPMAFTCVIVVSAGLLAGALAGRGLSKTHPTAFPAYTPLLMVASAFPNSFSVPLTLHLALADQPLFEPNAESRIMSLFAFSYVLWVLARWGIGYPVISGGFNSFSELCGKVANPPVFACVVAVAWGCLTQVVPALSSPSWGYPVGAAVRYAGQTTVPIQLAILGAQLAEAASPSQPTEKAGEESPLLEGPDGLPWAAYVAVVVCRQLLGIALGLGVGSVLVAWGVRDPVAVMVCMLQCAGPPMINLSVLAGLSGRHDREAAQLLLFTYLMSTVTWTLAIASFMHLLQSVF